MNAVLNRDDGDPVPAFQTSGSSVCLDLCTHPLDVVVCDAQLAVQQVVLALVLHHLGLEGPDLRAHDIKA